MNSSPYIAISRIESLLLEPEVVSKFVVDNCEGAKSSFPN